MKINPEEALKHLIKEPIKNVSLINLIENELFRNIEKIGDSILLRRKNKRGSIYIASEKSEDIVKILETLGKDDKHFSAIEGWILPIIQERRIIKRLNPGFKLYLPEEISIPKMKTKTRSLTEKDAPIVDKYWEYRHEDSLEYVKRRIKNSYSSGIEINGELVAWVIIHDDGSLGSIYVLPEHRGKGYAKDITIDLVQKLRKESKLPFVHIIEGNDNSLALAETLGFVKYKKVNWVTIE